MKMRDAKVRFFILSIFTAVLALLFATSFASNLTTKNDNDKSGMFF